MEQAALVRVGKNWASPLCTLVLATLYPTLFVLSQNWYTLSLKQSVSLLVIAPLAGATVYLIVEGLIRLGAWVEKYVGVRRGEENGWRREIFALVAASLVYFLLYRTLKSAFDSIPVLVLVYGMLACVGIFVARTWGLGGINAFLAMLSLVAVLSWFASAASQSVPPFVEKIRDFESAQFKSKPNIYLFIYDAYGSSDLYSKVIKMNNSAQYSELEARNFKVLHSFSNYTNTLQTTISIFMGAHHYYGTETGIDDSRIGRSLLSGQIHNSALTLLKSNGYHVQYIHGLDYFVNEQGILDYIYPPQHLVSALRIFDIPILKMKRQLSMEEHKRVLYGRVESPTSRSAEPWFTFVHVNLPAHVDSSRDWRQHVGFEKNFEARTVKANAHMLETIDAIRRSDPEAIVVIFGDHGSHGYNKIWESGKVWQRDGSRPDFGAEQSSTEIVSLDAFGIMIAVGSNGRCDNYVYPGLTPVNIFRVLAACLAGQQGLLERKEPDISVLKDSKGRLWLAAENGGATSVWLPFIPNPN